MAERAESLSSCRRSTGLAAIKDQVLGEVSLTGAETLSWSHQDQLVKVLKTLPWNKVTIHVVCVEYKHVPEGGASLTSFLQERGYALHSTVGDDLIFVRKELMEGHSKEGIL